MKSLIIALSMLISVAAFSVNNVEITSNSVNQSIEKSATTMLFPQLQVWGNSVSVRIWNTTRRDARCSGMIYMRSAQGLMEQRFYSSVIYAGMTDNRHFYPRLRRGDRLMNAHHSIFCNLY